MQTTLIEQGLKLMYIGTATVFAFLIVLVIVTSLMSRIVRRWIPEDISPITNTRESRLELSSSVDPHIVQVIQSAVHRYRQGE